MRDGVRLRDLGQCVGGLLGQEWHADFEFAPGDIQIGVSLGGAELPAFGAQMREQLLHAMVPGRQPACTEAIRHPHASIFEEVELPSRATVIALRKASNEEVDVLMILSRAELDERALRSDIDVA